VGVNRVPGQVVNGEVAARSARGTTGWGGIMAAGTVADQTGHAEFAFSDSGGFAGWAVGAAGCLRPALRIPLICYLSAVTFWSCLAQAMASHW